MRKSIFKIMLLAVITMLFACQKEENEPVPQISETDVPEIVIPDQVESDNISEFKNFKSDLDFPTPIIYWTIARFTEFTFTIENEYCNPANIYIRFWIKVEAPVNAEGDLTICQNWHVIHQGMYRCYSDAEAHYSAYVNDGCSGRARKWTSCIQAYVYDAHTGKYILRQSPFREFQMWF